jgi:hypothetical protein
MRTLACGEKALNAFAGSSIVRIFPRRAFSPWGLLHHSDAGAERYAPKMCIEDWNRTAAQARKSVSPRAITVALWHSFCFSLLRKNPAFPLYFQQHSFRDHRRNAWLQHPPMCSKT